MSEEPAPAEAVTRGVRVRVLSRYAPERSDPESHHYFFLYQVEIANLGTETVQLTDRHWVITDANGRVEEVRGPGVVGEKPVLIPGGAFRYVSACPLQTPFGVMHGTYHMTVADTGEGFDAEIPPFSLGEPTTVH